VLEIVLGIDNIVFIAIVTERLPEEHQSAGRRVGLLLALVMRLALLFTLSWMMGLDRPFATVPEVGWEVSGRTLILLAGGLFLLVKATQEIYHKTELVDEEAHTEGASTMASVLFQIVLMDLIFSIDSIVTAVGMVDELVLMVTAVVIAVVVMIVFANPVSEFVSEHPSVKMLALAFLMLVGVLLVVEATGGHVDRGYVYFAMGFSLAVEMLNLRYRANLVRKKVARAET
jgi:predicted tellurium resistance membrane protein TerC